MIKSVSLLTRKDGLTHEDFVKHWLDVHAPLAHAVPGVRRYVQSHIVEERTRPDIPSTDVEIDGIVQPAPAPRFSRTVPDLPIPPQPPSGLEEAEAILADWLEPAEIATLRASGTI
jgi:hypothetical protein